MNFISKTKALLTVALLTACFHSKSQFQWAKTITGPDLQLITDIQTDAAGNVFVAQILRDSADFDPGPGVFYLNTPVTRDIVISKFDAAGNFVWARQMGGPNFPDIPEKITLDNNANIYITGFFQEVADFDPGPGTYTLSSVLVSPGVPSWDVYVCKLDSSGNFQWARSIGSNTTDIGQSVSVDPSGNVYISGYFQSTMDFDPGPGTYNLTSSGAQDVFALKLNASGNFVWARKFGGTVADQSFAGCIDQAGSFYINGRFNGTSDFDPGAGTHTLTSLGGDDLFTVKLDAAGNFVWVAQFGGTGNEGVGDVISDASANVYISGNFSNIVDFDPGAGTHSLTVSGTVDAFLAKLDSSGNFIWVKQIGGGGCTPSGLDRDVNGNFYLGGNFGGTVDFDPGPGSYTLSTANNQRMFLSKLDSTGNFLWAGQFGGSSVESCNAVKTDNNGNVYAGGFFTQTADLDPSLGTFTATANEWDIFLSKIGTNCLNPPLIQNSIQGAANLCAGAAAQIYSIDPINGITSYTWSLPSGWTGVSTTNTISLIPSASGVFSVVASNACGTSAVSTKSITVNPLPVVNIAGSTPALCDGQSATLTANGASTYLWSTGATSTVISVSPGFTSTYTVTGIDNNGCINLATFTQSVHALPTINSSGSNSVLCFGESATLTASGASTYTWNPGGSGSSILVSPNATTIYTVTGTDTNGCQNSSVLSITIITLPAITISSSHSIVCQNESATLTASGALSYSWSAGGTTPTISVTPGLTSTYSVTGTDANGCQNLTSFTQSVSIPELTVSAGNATLCTGQTTTLTVVGAVSFTWNPGGTGSMIQVSPTVTSTFSVIGINEHGCQDSSDITILVNSLPVISSSVNSGVVCDGETATLDASGASTYTWNPGGVGASIQVSPNTTTIYTVTGSDLNSCQSSATVSIIVNPLPNINNSTSSTVVCVGESATLSASGASTYTWNPGGAGQSIVVSPNITSSYTVTGTDANNCVNTATLSVGVNSLPNVSGSTSNTVICVGENATLSASGASTYTWNPGGAGQSIVVSPGVTSNYTVTGTDGNNCVNAATLSVGVNSLPNVSGSTSNTVICVGESATLSASGASTYTWNPGGAGQSIVISPNITSSYTVTGTDANNCVNTATLSVGVNPLPSVNGSASSTVVCIGESATLSASGAFTYTWNPGGAGQSIVVSPGVTSNYTVTGTDANNCTNATTLSVGVNPLPSVNGSASSTVVCIGESATLSASGAFTYTWNPGGAGQSIVVSPGVTSNYTVTGTDANNCTNATTLSVGVNPLPSVNGSASSTFVCIGESATLSANGASTYTWNPGGAGSSIIILPNVTTTYTVTGTDANNCVNTATLSVGVNSLPNVSGSTSTTIVCIGESATLSASGASTYTWNPGGINQSIIVSPGVITIYTVSGTGANNCKNSATVSIMVNELPILNISSSNTFICIGESIVLTASGALTYTWDSGVTGSTISISPTITSTYTLSGTDTNNCQNTLTHTQFVSTCTGYKDPGLPREKVLVFPNPTSGKISLQGIYDMATVKIFNSIGKLVIDACEFKATGTGINEIDISKVPNGIYFLKTDIYSWKIIKE